MLRLLAMLLLATGGGAGCDGLIIAPSGDETDEGTGPSEGSAGPLRAEDIPESGVRHLTRTELDNTLQLLLGEERPLARELLPEENVERQGLFLHWPFDNAYPKQESGKVHVQALEALAEEAAQGVVSDEDALAELLPCEPTGPGDAECMRRLIRELGEAAFRRPLTEEEVSDFMTLHPLAVEAGDFAYGVDAVLRAMLQSPDFVYRVEVGKPDPQLPGVSRLTDHEIITRMAFLLWGSAPDAALLAIADAGGLSDPELRRSIARDMLGDPRAKEQVARFHAMWLGYTTMPHTPELAEAMRKETRALLRRVIFQERRPYLDVFTFDETYVEPELAEHYGLPSPGPEAGWVPYGDSGRLGLLSHGTVLGAFSQVGDTSPTKRGIFVRERLLCQTLAPPPEEVNVDEPPEVECRSDFIEVHQSGSCATCHQLMDPIGWGLERYGMTGQYRTHDRGKPECPIDGRGEVVDMGTFTGPGELASLLVVDGTLEACVIRQVVRFALGREDGEGDRRFIESLTEPRLGTDWTFLELLTDIVASEYFVRMRPDPVGADGDTASE